MGSHLDRRLKTDFLIICSYQSTQGPLSFDRLAARTFSISAMSMTSATIVPSFSFAMAYAPIALPRSVPRGAGRWWIGLSKSSGCWTNSSLL